MSTYFRPLVQTGGIRPADAVPLAGGWAWFTHVECLQRDRAAQIIPACSLPYAAHMRLTVERPPIAGLDCGSPRLMGILNATPDSFSDGGQFLDPKAAEAQGHALLTAGADILDVGGESTRPGAGTISEAEEIARTTPVITALAKAGVPVSIDTRKAGVARAAWNAGARVINDVAALGFDPDLAPFAAKVSAPVCLMHAQGTPQTMQQNPVYDDVLLDVYDFLQDAIERAEAAGIVRSRIIVDPGIGFGKTTAHNLALLRGIALFHSLGCPILLGVSRKGFIGQLGAAPDPADRVPGTLAVTLHAVSQGVQFHRVHDIAPAKQALALASALMEGHHGT